MAIFSSVLWKNTTSLYAKSYTCWNCGNLVSSSAGYSGESNYSSNLNSQIYICPHCKAPMIIDSNKNEFPNAIIGEEIKKPPEDIKNVYNEARNSISTGAYTGAVMLLRKILMNLAVEDGAKEGDSFSNYVKYLCDNGLVHKKQNKQAENIRRLGNDANHKIESRTKDEALELLQFIELLLKNNYEFADE